VKKRSVEWAEAALTDLEGQIAYIAADNPYAAQRVLDQINQSAAGLVDMIMGRPGRVSGTYEKLVAHLPYIIAFAVEGDAGWEVITVLRVIHTSRDWPPESWPADDGPDIG
jgi:toxin ParE1/3/4